MPNIYSQFHNLNQINPNNILANLKFSLPQPTIQNYLANRIIYPDAIPTTTQEMQLELAILTEIVRLNNVFFLNHSLKKITIPPDFVNNYKNLDSLIYAILTGLEFEGMAEIFIKNVDISTLTGTAIFHKCLDQSKVDLFINSQKKTQKIPSIGKYQIRNATINIGDLNLTAAGGELGIWIKLT